MARRRYFFSTLVDVCLLGKWTSDAISSRLDEALYAYEPWTAELAQQLVDAFPQSPRPAALLRYLLRNEHLARERMTGKLRIHQYPLQPPQATLTHPSLPPLHTLADLAHWLHLSHHDLEWFADRARLSAASPINRCRHYHVRTVPKSRGGVRLIEAPKPTLKHLQRRVHRELLAYLPLHPAAHGFIPGRTPIEHAQLHVGQPVVLRFDLQDCFLHVHGGMAYRAFSALGFTDSVSRYLMALCTHSIAKTHLPPLALDEKQQQLAQQNHLPQGAPTSPLLSHFALRGVDRRLQGYAQALEATYSRYADDIVLSGGNQLHCHFRHIHARVGSIVAEEGFNLNYRKSLCLTQSRQQRITGITVNRHPNLPRNAFDNLKAKLHNCVRMGWKSQRPEDCADYRSHLLGRIGWCQQLNPTRAAKLQALFDAIDWNNEKP